MVYLTAAAFLIIGYVTAQDPDCDYVQTIRPNERYNINNNYGPGGRTCRYTLNCLTGYNCRADCNLSIPSSTGCTRDRLLISRTGDPTLSGAQSYCGSGSLTAVSTSNRMTIGLVAPQTSPGGSFRCDLTTQIAPTPPTPACICGQKKQTRIVGGVETAVNEYPMMVVIIENAINDVHCGGVIISNSFIMTAAHCVTPFRTRPQALSVRVGTHNIEGSNTGTTYTISRFIIHERFNPITYDYDIALIELRVPIVYSDTATPVCLPFNYVGNSLEGSTCTILGWGTTSFGGQLSNSLQKVDVTVINQNVCRASEGDIVTDRQICTYTRGKDACQYDSGGPLLGTGSTNGLQYAMGIVSSGNMCGTARPGVFTRVTEFLSWIVSNVRADFCRK